MADRVGIVVVSHSPALADAAVELAMAMAQQDPPTVVTAAGTEDGEVGTDPARVMAAVEEAASPAGVVVLMDLGSAVMSAEMALEMLGEVDHPVRLTSAPLVEGLVAAVVQAANGGDVDRVVREARNALRAKAEHLGEDEQDDDADGVGGDEGEPDASAEVELVNPHGLHARPAARFVEVASRGECEVRVADTSNARGPVDARSLSSIGTLGAEQGHVLRLTATGDGAQEVVDELVALVEDGFGELEEQADADDHGEAHGDDEQPDGPVGVSPGRATGPVVRMPELPHDREPDADERVDPDAREDAVARLEEAVDAVASRLRARAEEVDDGDAADVLSATASMARDPAIVDGASGRVRDDGLTAQRAVWVTAGDVAERFRSSGGRMAERVRDVEDVRDRLVAALTDQPSPGVPQRDEPYVLVATDLAPADTATLDRDLCVALVTARGGPASHTAILARSLGIPAVVGHPDIDQLAEGRRVLVDGDTGEVVLEPDEEQAPSAG